MDCVTKQTMITHGYFAYKYGTMIFSVSEYTCAMIPNDKIWYLKQVKDEPPIIRRRFSRSGSYSIWMAKPLKSRVRVRVRVGRVRVGRACVRAVYKQTLSLQIILIWQVKTVKCITIMYQ